MGFIKSKQQGDFAENEVSVILSSLGTVTKNNGVYYDLFLDFEGGYHFEIKNDIMANRTGNIAVEYYNSKKEKPSGISATTATFWVFYLNPREIFMIHVDQLRSLCYNARTLDKVGDGNASIYLIKKDKLESCSINLSNISNEDLKSHLSRK